MAHDNASYAYVLAVIAIVALTVAFLYCTGQQRAAPAAEEADKPACLEFAAAGVSTPPDTTIPASSGTEHKGQE